MALNIGEKQMKKVLIILGIALLCLPVVATADEAQPKDTAAVKGDAETDVKVAADEATPMKKVTLAEYLIGVWDMAPTKYIPSGDLTFKADGTYEKNEKDFKGVGAGAKGEYKLYPELEPCGIDICLSECGQSEWTTLFGIVRMLDDGRVEIQTSPNSTRPTEFAKEPGDSYTKLLTRRVVKE